jgi:hypothetical protein
VPRCHIRIPWGRTPNPFCGNCNPHLSHRFVSSSYKGFYFYCSGILSSDVYLNVRLADRDKILGRFEANRLCYSGSCGYSGQILGRRYSFHCFYHKAQCGNMGQACVTHKVTINNCSPHDYTYGTYTDTRVSPSELLRWTMSPAKFKCSYNTIGQAVIPRTVVLFAPCCSALRRLWVYLFVRDETSTLDEHLFCIQWL